MWAVRRASSYHRNAFFLKPYWAQGAFAERVSQCCYDTAEKSLITHLLCTGHDSNGRSYHTVFSAWKHSFSTHVGARSSEEEENDSYDPFSELEESDGGSAFQDKTVEPESSDDELISEPESSADKEMDTENPEERLNQNRQELESVGDAGNKKEIRNRISTEIFQAVVSDTNEPLQNFLDKWVADGRELTRTDISLTMLYLRRRRMFGRALQVSDWMEKSGHLEFVDRDYASRLDLIAKMRGLQRAELYLEKIPASVRGELMYRTLLANCVMENNVKKSEEVFNRMKELELQITSFACNQLLLLYKRVDRKKIADVLLLMEKENIKPSLFTYKILIDTKGLSNDISGMDQIIETMKGEGIEPDISTQALIVRHYVSVGLKEKAEALLKEMEGSNIYENRWVCRFVLPLYAALGKAEEVGRLWKVCESEPRLEECMAAIEAWGKLGEIEEAESIFEKVVKTWKKLSSKHYSTLLKVYAAHKMVEKGKKVLKRMEECGCRIGPLTWDALVNLYLEAGDVERAASILQKAPQRSQVKPLFSSFMAVMNQYARKGDVHNSEKMFHRMRLAGYTGRIGQFYALVQAYNNGNVPFYGARERMKADGIFPNRVFSGQISMMDPFRNTAVSDLLE